MKKPKEIIDLEKKFDILIAEIPDIPSVKDLDNLFGDFGIQDDYYFIRNTKNEITHLSLSSLQILDISFIQSFHQLISLQLNSNKISDITVLENLKRLRYLNLNGNNISSLKSSSELNLMKYLNLRNNKISSITPLKNMKSLEAL